VSRREGFFPAFFPTTFTNFEFLLENDGYKENYKL
jgi:hypothetical protein